VGVGVEAEELDGVGLEAGVVLGYGVGVGSGVGVGFVMPATSECAAMPIKRSGRILRGAVVFRIFSMSHKQ